MPRVSVHATDDASGEPVDDDLDGHESAFDPGLDDDEDRYERDPRRRERKRQRRRRDAKTEADVEIEREVTKRAIIEAVTRLVVVILYMAFTLVREREAGVVALDPEDDDLGPEDDWAEA